MATKKTTKKAKHVTRKAKAVAGPALCPLCHGTGRDKPEATCPKCEGTGKAK